MKKRISVLLLCCIVFISGCNMPGQDDQKIKKLDPEKLDSETTDINDRVRSSSLQFLSSVRHR